jgi:type I site-specific restriction endonuclease
LIFNNGIITSLHVYDSFRHAGYNIRHLDNTTSSEDRKDILQWFKKTPDAILTSVGILTTGFDEPTVESIILNRATKSLTLYFQMIGRGSRRLPNKENFTVIDLGNNALRFGLWDNPIDWQHIFKSPEYYLESLREDAEIESNFKYVMPEELRKKFSKTVNIFMDINDEFKFTVKNNLKAKTIIEKSLEQHATMCIDNTNDLFEARQLSKVLKDDIEYRIKQYCNCLGNVTKNYRSWLIEDYTLKLIVAIGKIYRSRIINELD